MKNIYLVDEQVSSARNGIGTYLQEIISALKGMDVNINIIRFNSKKEEFDIELKSDIRIFHFPKFLRGSFTEHPDIISKFFRLFIEDSAENIFFLNHSPCETLMVSLKESYPLSKIVFTIHDQGWTSSLLGNVKKFKKIISRRTSSEVKKSYSYLIEYFNQERRMYDIADRVLCLSNDSYSLLKETYKVKENKIFLSGNGLSDSFRSLDEKEKNRIREKLHLASNEKIILHIGRVQNSKGCKALLRSFKQVLSVYPNCRLVLAGTLYDPDSFLDESASISSKVSFTGQISKEELKEWLRIADVGVLPSYTEQCSYAGIEMMMHGLPIVASDGWGVRNMFIDGYNTIRAPIVNYSNSSIYEKNLVTAIIKLLMSENLRFILSENARKEYEQKYAISVMSNRYRELIITI